MQYSEEQIKAIREEIKAAREQVKIKKLLDQVGCETEEEFNLAAEKLNLPKIEWHLKSFDQEKNLVKKTSKTVVKSINASQNVKAQGLNIKWNNDRLNRLAEEIGDRQLADVFIKAAEEYEKTGSYKRLFDKGENVPFRENSALFEIEKPTNVIKYFRDRTDTSKCTDSAIITAQKYFKAKKIGNKKSLIKTRLFNADKQETKETKNLVNDETKYHDYVFGHDGSVIIEKKHLPQILKLHEKYKHKNKKYDLSGTLAEDVLNSYYKINGYDVKPCSAKLPNGFGDISDSLINNMHYDHKYCGLYNSNVVYISENDIKNINIDMISVLTSPVTGDSGEIEKMLRNGEDIKAKVVGKCKRSSLQCAVDALNNEVPVSGIEKVKSKKNKDEIRYCIDIETFFK